MSSCYDIYFSSLGTDGAKIFLWREFPRRNRMTGGREFVNKRLITHMKDLISFFAEMKVVTSMM